MGHEVIAFTEHDSVSNAVDIENYYEKIKKDHPNFKVIRGNEIYLCRNDLDAENFNAELGDGYYHFILLAKDSEGHRQIRELSTRAWTRSYVARGMRRVPTYYRDLIEIIGSNQGHVIATNACLGGFLDKKLVQYIQLGKPNDFYEKIIDWTKNVENIFGKGNFFLEMQPSYSEEQIAVNKELFKLSKKLNIPYIITTDSHYIKKEDSLIHEAYLNSQNGEREVKSFYASTYIMSTQEIEEYFLSYLSQEDLQIAYQNIINIKNMCEDYTLKKPLKIPSLAWVKQDHISTQEKDYYFNKIPKLLDFYTSDYEADKYLVKAVINGIKKHEDLQNEEAFKELNENLKMTWESSLVNKAQWSAYFLNLQRILEECWNAGTLVGPARGSGGGFLLLYCLDIIQINKLKENTPLFSWRFLNPDRVSPLDIDVDIEGGRRAQVLTHLREVFGEDRVSNVSTFRTEKSKSAILTAARGLGIDVDTAQYIASLIPADRGQLRSLSECYYGDEEKGFSPISSFIQQMREYPDLWRVAKNIEGLISGSGLTI